VFFVYSAVLLILVFHANSSEFTKKSTLFRANSRQFTKYNLRNTFTIYFFTKSYFTGGKLEIQTKIGFPYFLFGFPGFFLRFPRHPFYRYELNANNDKNSLSWAFSQNHSYLKQSIAVEDRVWEGRWLQFVADYSYKSPITPTNRF
jgi:hypothetical protein